ncbi:MAG: phosphopantetheine-binding protein [Phycisphaerae bacterium]
MPASPMTSDRIAGIIRRDLKLGDDVELTSDTVLFGGELDLDSLDALLLIQSIEKDFGIKVATEAMGPEIFATLHTLTDFVESRTKNR